MTKTKLKRCNKCKSPRGGCICWKCDEPTFKPSDDWEEPLTPPIEEIRLLAKEVGYAIGEHGSKERDLDLIAAPWTDSAVSSEELIEHIAQGVGATVVDSGQKPLGRVAVNLQMDGWFKLIDLSVCPRINQ